LVDFGEYNLIAAAILAFAANFVRKYATTKQYVK